MKYNKHSPYYETPQTTWYLRNMVYRDIPSHRSDLDYTIENRYDERPGKYAYDLYGDERLFWVFSARNRNIIRDPIFDFRTGLEIKIPTQQRIIELLG